MNHKRNKKNSSSPLPLSKYQLLFNQMTVGLAYVKVILDKNHQVQDFIFQDINQAYMTINNHTSKEEVLGKKLSDFVPPEEMAKNRDILNEFGKVLHSRSELMLERFIHLMNRWIRLSAFSPGEQELVLMIEDISPRKQEEERFHQKINFEKMINEIANQAIFIEDFHSFIQSSFELIGTTLNVSRVYLFQYNPIQKTFTNTYEWTAPNISAEIHHLQNIPESLMPISTKYLLSGGMLDYCDIHKFADRTAINMLQDQDIKSLLIAPLLQREELHGFMGFDECRYHRNWDESEKNVLSTISKFLIGLLAKYKTQKQLQESESAANALINATKDTVCLLDRRGCILEINEISAARLGQTRQEIVGQNIFDILEEKQIQDCTPQFNKVIQTGESVHFELKIDEGAIHADVIIYPVFNEGKTVEGAAVFMRDISERVVMEEQLKYALMKAKEADRLKSAFLANMSHEVRTPLNTITLYLDIMLMKYNRTLEFEKDIQTIRSSVDNLLYLINDVMDLSKIESQQMRIENLPCSIHLVFHNVGVHAKHFLEKKQEELELISKIDSSISPNIMADPERLQQILNNLVINALKYTEKGKVEYGVKQTAEELLQFYVQDRGIGIAPEDQEIIFEPFVQIQSPLSKMYSGTGLGLTIAKKLVKLMNGDIGLISEKGEGSLFYFTLPYVPVKHPVAEKKYKMDEVKIQQNLTFLLVEDNPSNQLAMQQLLKGFGYKVIIANDGQEAFFQYKSNPKIDLILMDIQIPQINGLETTKLIRKTEISQRKKRIPIIALTAAALKEDIQNGLKAGCDSYLTKPVNIEKLMEVIKMYAPKQ